MSYCDYVKNLPSDNVHVQYHNCEYGFPIESDNELFERLVLEINQAGLSWQTILNKKENFKKAYANFDLKTVANYSEDDFDRLMADAGIIRNKLKIKAAIYNANVILNLQKSHGSFKSWLNAHYQLSKPEWIKLFKRNFKFTGGEITNEFLMSTGYLKGAHDENCSVYEDIKKLNPMWLQK